MCQTVHLKGKGAILYLEWPPFLTLVTLSVFLMPILDLFVQNNQC